MTWNYDCSNYGSAGNFIVDINGSTSSDVGPNELNTSGGGTDYYYDAGTFSFEIDSECNWSIAVAPSSGSPPELQSASPAARPVIRESRRRSPSVGCGQWPGATTARTTDPQATSSSTSISRPVIPTSRSVRLPLRRRHPPLPSPAASTGFTGIASTPEGSGYWIVDSTGDVVTEGDAVFHGSMGGDYLNAPISHIVATPDGGGYWLVVATDGGIFSFNGPFVYGSTGNIHLNRPINGMAATPDDLGYHFVASDGGVFDEGDAVFYGSTGGIRLNAPVVGLATDPATDGYWLVGSDGGVFSFNTPFEGSAA